MQTNGFLGLADVYIGHDASNKEPTPAGGYKEIRRIGLGLAGTSS